MDYVSVRAESDHQIRGILNNGRKLKPIYANVDIQRRRSRINLWRWTNSTVLIYWTTKTCSVIPVNYTKYSSNLKRKRQKLFENSYQLKLAFRNTPIVAFRGDKSLNDISVPEKCNNLFFKKQQIMNWEDQIILKKMYVIVCNHKYISLRWNGTSVGNNVD